MPPLTLPGTHEAVETEMTLMSRFTYCPTEVLYRQYICPCPGETVLRDVPDLAEIQKCVSKVWPVSLYFTIRGMEDEFKYAV